MFDDKCVKTKSLNFTRLLPIVIGIFLLLGLFFSVSLISKSGTSLFELRKKASVPLGDATLTLVTDSAQRYVGDVFPVKIYLNTHGNPISGIGLKLSYPFSGTSPELEVLDSDLNASNVQIKSHASELDSNFVTNVNYVYRQPATNGTVFIDLGITNASVSGFMNTTDQLLAEIVFKANRVTTKSIVHDPDGSQIIKKADPPMDILRTINPLDITVLADTAAPTVTITGGPAQNETISTPSATFTWRGIDNPARASDSAIPLLYAYQLDNSAWSAFTTATTATAALTHGAHIFRIKAKDPTGNLSTPTAPGSLRNFTVNLLPPAISGITPNHGPAGTVVTITGSNFGTVKRAVKFGAVTVPAASITSWTDREIVVKSPANGDGSVVITLPTPTRTSNTDKTFTLETKVKLVFNFDGITQDRGTRPVTVAVKRGTVYSQEFTGSATWNSAESAYEVTIGPLTPFTAATDYSISLKDGSRLRRRFTKLVLTKGILNIHKKKAAADKLWVADFNNDNKLTIEDFGLIMSKITQLSTTVTDALKPFDLDGDGYLKIDDVSRLLTNFTALEKLGDPE